jgi:biotin synthase
MIEDILYKSEFSKAEIIQLLETQGDEAKKLFEASSKIKLETVGRMTYFRGLIEFSNICSKNCYYCGIRRSNANFERYELSEAEVLKAAQFADENNYGSIVLQAGEISSPHFTEHIESLLKKIKALSNGRLGITLSLGEQSDETYRRWFDAGAHRYLIRIETSNRDLYSKLHPNDTKHSFDERIGCLESIKKIGYQVGTGVMIGLPSQTAEHLADDLLFMKQLDIDMCGMGPYIEHEDTPLYQYKDSLMPLRERFILSLKMVAILRLMMPNINIAATTAMQTIDPAGREKAIKIGANIIMPNITPGMYRDEYSLYQNKPCTDEEPEDCVNCLEARIKLAGSEIAYGKWGDSLHFVEKG